MSSAVTELPLRDTLRPHSAAEIRECVQACRERGEAIYPLGGGTSLSHGLPARREGVAVDLTGMDEIIDYPAGDMTVTVQAGCRMANLAALLAQQNQQLPLDVPQPDRATVGGVVACGWNGLRKLGYGGVRDQVIGIEAVDGQGRIFHGGGRVVKNVAGYDFCKLLTGSLGTLGIVTQVTFKLRPLPETQVALLTPLPNWEALGDALAAVANSALRPVTVAAGSGPDWHEALSSHVSDAKPAGDAPSPVWLGLWFEGPPAEVAWQVDHWRELSREFPGSAVCTLEAPQAAQWLHRGTEFGVVAAQPQSNETESDATAIVRLSSTPSGVAPLMSKARELDPNCELLADAGSGLVCVRFPAVSADRFTEIVQHHLRPLAARYHGTAVVVRLPAGCQADVPLIYGSLGGSHAWMQRVKQEFDPAGILNPGRFVV